MAKKKSISKISDIPESYQRYLDEIYQISKTNKGGWVSNKEISNRLEVKPSSVTGMLSKLKNEDLINWKERKSIRLTEKGKKIATQLAETHLILKKFFSEILKINDDILVNRISCDIEHHITQEVLKPLKELLKKYENK